MGYFPFFIDIAGKCGVIVGGGKVAARKVEKLIGFRPSLTVIAPKIEECLREQQEQLAENDTDLLMLKERFFQMSDLSGADFVIAATDDDALNGRISEHCMAEHIPVNVVDDREKCSFFFPALVREGSLTVGICTDGKSPVAAAWLRNEISQVIPHRLGEIIDLIGQMRPRVMEEAVPERVKKDCLEKLFLFCMAKEGKVTMQELEEYLASML